MCRSKRNGFAVLLSFSVVTRFLTSIRHTPSENAGDRHSRRIAYVYHFRVDYQSSLVTNDCDPGHPQSSLPANHVTFVNEQRGSRCHDCLGFQTRSELTGGSVVTTGDSKGLRILIVLTKPRFSMPRCSRFSCAFVEGPRSDILKLPFTFLESKVSKP